MASFLPFISEILPMIMPASTHITRAGDLQPSHSASDRPVVARPAVVGKCDKMCASVLTARPNSTSAIRHNSEQDAIIYATSGTGTLVVKEGFEDNLLRHQLNPGDFAFLPAWTEHQVCNESDSDLVWVVFQSGSSPVGATLEDWGGDETAADD